MVTAITTTTITSFIINALTKTIVGAQERTVKLSRERNRNGEFDWLDEGSVYHYEHSFTIWKMLEKCKIQSAIEGISSDTHTLQFIELHNLKLKILKSI